MAYYIFSIHTSAGDEFLYDGDSDKLMRDLNAIDGSNRTGTVLVEDEKIALRKEVFEELSRIRSLFEQNENNFVIYDSFQHVKERKFSIEFLKDDTIKVVKLEEEENEL